MTSKYVTLRNTVHPDGDPSSLRVTYSPNFARAMCPWLRDYQLCRRNTTATMRFATCIVRMEDEERGAQIQSIRLSRSITDAVKLHGTRTNVSTDANTYCQVTRREHGLSGSMSFHPQQHLPDFFSESTGLVSAIVLPSVMGVCEDSLLWRALSDTMR